MVVKSPSVRRSCKNAFLCPLEMAKTQSLFLDKMHINLFGSIHVDTCSPCTASRPQHLRWEQRPRWAKQFRPYLRCRTTARRRDFPIRCHHQSASSLSPPSIFAPHEADVLYPLVLYLTGTVSASSSDQPLSILILIVVLPIPRISDHSLIVCPISPR